MISRQQKALFYTALAVPMRVNASLYRHWLAPRSGTVRVQLGPGREKYLDGWINVDANFITAKQDVWADLRNGLPFEDETVDALYSHHVIEHLPDADLPRHFAEVFRVLKPGGVFRIGGPNGDTACRKLVEGDAEWFGDFPDKRDSIGGKFANFILCRGEHLTILTASYLDELARGAGFPQTWVQQPTATTRFPEHFDARVLTTEWESTPEAPHTLIIEGQRH